MRASTMMAGGSATTTRRPPSTSSASSPTTSSAWSSSTRHRGPRRVTGFSCCARCSLPARRRCRPRRCPAASRMAVFLGRGDGHASTSGYKHFVSPTGAFRAAGGVLDIAREAGASVTGVALPVPSRAARADERERNYRRVEAPSTSTGLRGRVWASSASTPRAGASRSAARGPPRDREQLPRAAAGGLRPARPARRLARLGTMPMCSP